MVAIPRAPMEKPKTDFRAKGEIALPLVAEIQLDPNNSHHFVNAENGLTLLLDGEYGLSVRVYGRKEDWVSLVRRLESWGLIQLGIKEDPGAS